MIVVTIAVMLFHLVGWGLCRAVARGDLVGMAADSGIGPDE